MWVFNSELEGYTGEEGIVLGGKNILLDSYNLQTIEELREYKPRTRDEWCDFSIHYYLRIREYISTVYEIKRVRARVTKKELFIKLEKDYEDTKGDIEEQASIVYNFGDSRLVGGRRPAKRGGFASTKALDTRIAAPLDLELSVLAKLGYYYYYYPSESKDTKDDGAESGPRLSPKEYLIILILHDSTIDSLSYLSINNYTTLLEEARLPRVIKKASLLTATERSAYTPPD
ncbi:hypothetical protein BGZ57DRAFT_862710 [Hyaloscypha finlandica]|nr:hypothetical protein BGZ57DRAFT_862710 [Hyaloscypha finlandica]